ncbi:hypothetical protein [Nocardia sp. NPDC052566]|uniref:hypothetical protein n=1 Tax=Nocardia sp. NPDC052566 TaxID=3364330 RepID=UPI0037CBE658
MTDPSGDEYAPLESWQLRLLERLQNVTADHLRVLFQGYPQYHPHDGAGTFAVQTWRAQLAQLAAEREEFQTRAVTAGIPEELIDGAIAAGAQGMRWGNSEHAAVTMRVGDDPVRERLVVEVVGDIWKTEHMALIAVERRTRLAVNGFAAASAPELEQQYGRNMAALWTRASRNADIADLTPDERSRAWGRDRTGWHRLAKATVATYSDAELEERWRAYAWPGIERATRNDSATTDAVAERQPRIGLGPPTPDQLIERAEQTLNGTIVGGTGRDISDAVEAVVDDGASRWGPELDGAVDTTARPGIDRGYGL